MARGYRGLDSLDHLSHEEVRRLVLALVDKLGGEVELDAGNPPDVNRRIDLVKYDHRPGVTIIEAEGEATR